jgi:hypothetical protein
LVNCKFYANIIEVKDFIKFVPSTRILKDTIQIKIYGQTSSDYGRVLPLEIYTFYNEDFTDLVD